MNDLVPSLPLRASTRLRGTTVRLDRFRTCTHGWSVDAVRCDGTGRPVFDAAGEPERETIHLESSTDLVAFERYLRSGRGVVRLEQTR
jgi:hypothetical protein